MSEPYCPQHHPRRYSQCGCPLPKPPVKPQKTDTCKWCLNFPYANCRMGHWRLINEEYERDLAHWQQTYGTEGRVEKSPVKLAVKREAPTVAPRVPRPAVTLVLPPGVREWLAELGHRGGSSRSERKRTASRLNGKRGGRPKHFTHIQPMANM